MTRSHTLRALASVTLAATVMLGAPSASGAEEGLRQRLSEAVSAYERAQASKRREHRQQGFRQAERLFQAAVGDGAANPELLTNLGAAALSAERLGPAVLAFRRALWLDPDHARARRNLAYARDLLPGWAASRDDPGAFDSFFGWHRSLSFEERFRIAALCFFIACAALGHGLARKSATARNLALLPALAWGVVLGSLLADAYRGENNAAVIIVDEVVARAADSPNAPGRFSEPLPAGAEIDVALPVQREDLSGTEACESSDREHHPVGLVLPGGRRQGEVDTPDVLLPFEERGHPRIVI